MKKILICSLIFCLFLTGSYLPVKAEETEETIHRTVSLSLCGGVTIWEDETPVYERSRASGEPLGYIQAGEKLLCAGESWNEGWYKVIFHGKTAYVQKEKVWFSSSMYSGFLESGVCRVNVSMIQIRKGPGLEFSCMSEYMKGTRLYVTGIDGEWLIIRTGAGKGYVWSSSMLFEDDWVLSGEGKEIPFEKTIEASDMVYVNMRFAELIREYFRGKGFTEEGIAGIMGNMFGESAMLPMNLENQFEAVLNYTDGTYTQAVDRNWYNKDKFINDHAGYGICQWTDTRHKKELHAMAKKRKISIGDLMLQLDYLYSDLLLNYPDLFSILKNTHSVEEASTLFFFGYEISAYSNAYVIDLRTSYSYAFFEDVIHDANR